jgi:hypothetical protein
MKTCILMFVLLPRLALSSGAAAPGQPVTKPAWQWSDEERTTARTNPGPSGHHPLSAESTSVSEDHTQFLLDGSRNPELLMPAELFNSLTLGLWGERAVREDARSRYRDAIRKFGWDEDAFWGTLAKLDHRQQELQRRLLSRDLKPDDGERLNVEACTARLTAFRDVKATLGADKFVQFLYTAVAPGMILTARVGADEQERLRWVEGGCQ